MFPKRKVNALTPIFASLKREKEDLSLSPKIPMRYVRNSLQILQTYSSEFLNETKVQKIFIALLQLYKKKKLEKQKLKFSSEKITDEKKDLKSTEELKEEMLSLQSEIISPFSKFSSDVFDEQLEQILTPFFIEHLIYGSVIQKVADDFQVIIGLKMPIKTGQSLLLNNYSTANFTHCLKYSEIGPTAGLLTYDAVYCTGNREQQQYHQNTINDLLKKEAKLIDLKLSESLLINAIRYGYLKKIDSEIYSAIYFGQLFDFEISPPDFIVRNLNIEKIVKVLANADELTPFTDNYNVSFFAVRKNTPGELLAQKNKLIDIIVDALNKEINMKENKTRNIFVYNKNMENKRECFFFPSLQPKQLVNDKNRELLYQKIIENEYYLINK